MSLGSRKANVGEISRIVTLVLVVFVLSSEAFCLDHPYFVGDSSALYRIAQKFLPLPLPTIGISIVPTALDAVPCARDRGETDILLLLGDDSTRLLNALYLESNDCNLSLKDVWTRLNQKNKITGPFAVGRSTAKWQPWQVSLHS